MPYKKRKKKEEKVSSRQLVVAVKKVNRLYKARELKFHEVTVNSAFNNSGTIVLLSGLAQGDSGSARDGDKISMQSIYFGGRAMIASSSYDLCRVIIFRFNVTDGVSPIPSDVLAQTATASIIDSPYNFLKRRQYSIVADKVITLNANSNHVVSWKQNTPLKGSQAFYQGTGNTVTSTSTGTLFALFCSDKAGTPPTVAGTFRLKYYDS